MKSSIPLLFLSFISFLTLLILLFRAKPYSLSFSSSLHSPSTQCHTRLKIYVADLSRSFNYGLLDQYWSLSSPDSRINADPDAELRSAIEASGRRGPLPYPENPLIKQYSAEYWLLGDLETPARSRAVSSVVERVYDWRNADVVFVPFFATLSAEMELGWGRQGGFLKKEGNGDYRRQRDVVDRIKSSDAWKRSGGRDHVFVLTDPVAMWHVRAEIASAMLLVVDFGGWYKLDPKESQGNTSHMIQHTQVSLIKDVIVPYTHLLPRLQSLEDQPRSILLYFKGAKHRHRGGLIREKLWDVLLNEHDVVMEEGFPNATGREQSIKGMRSSEFCLHPAGDTPTSCRLFDAVLSLCIPVIISDNIELPFEGTIDYSEFAVFVSTNNALQPGWLVAYLRSFSEDRKNGLRRNMASIQQMFEYDNGSPGGVGPVDWDGAVSNIWRKVQQKVPLIKEAIVREKRKPGVFLNGFVCKNPMLVNEKDFLFTGLNKPGNTTNQLGSKVTLVSVTQLPGLNTLGISLARIDFAPYGLNPLHTHPRASEILVVIKGSLFVGFITSNNPDNKLFTEVLNEGDVFVFPQGLIHFQLNNGNTDAVAISALSSQNPGVITIANAIFGSKPPINRFVLEKGFQLDEKTVEILQAKFWMNNN